jgi:hypothetical protein
VDLNDLITRADTRPEIVNPEESPIYLEGVPIRYIGDALVDLLRAQIRRMHNVPGQLQPR